MNFSKDSIIDFKDKFRSYFTWRKNLDRYKIKDAFFPNSRVPVQEMFPDKNIEYCQMPMYDICVGDYHLGIKYTNETGTYYMFLAANSDWAAPGDVAIGKAVKGQIYLLREIMYPYSPSLILKIVPEEYVNRNERGFRPRSYTKSIWMNSAAQRREELREEITDKDIRCLRIAYEGVKAFSKLISELGKVDKI